MMTEGEFLEKYADELPSYEFVNGRGDTKAHDEEHALPARR